MSDYPDAYLAKDLDNNWRSLFFSEGLSQFVLVLAAIDAIGPISEKRNAQSFSVVKLRSGRSVECHYETTQEAKRFHDRLMLKLEDFLTSTIIDRGGQT